MQVAAAGDQHYCHLCITSEYRSFHTLLWVATFSCCCCCGVLHTYCTLSNRLKNIACNSGCVCVFWCVCWAVHWSHCEKESLRRQLLTAAPMQKGRKDGTKKIKINTTAQGHAAFTHAPLCYYGIAEANTHTVVSNCTELSKKQKWRFAGKKMHK